MCGIAGCNREDKKLIRAMTDAVSHRGPDAHDYYVDNGISLGHRRLSIIDLSKLGNQPMITEDGNYVLIYNGEVYNHNDIRAKLQAKGHTFKSKTDSEVVLHAYQEYGPACFSMFNGFFGLAIYDKKKNHICIARDRIGIKPVYYYAKNNLFLFGSEIKSILEHPDVPRAVCTKALNEFFTFRYIPHKETIYQDIHRLQAGHYAVYDCTSNQVSIQQFWDVPLVQSKDSVAAAATKISDLFVDSVQKRLMSDVPLGAYLSGGIDSTSVVAAMSQLGVQNIKTFSVGFESDTVGFELPFAKQVAQTFNTDHTELHIKSDCITDLPDIIWHLDEPLSDPAVVPVYQLSRRAKKDVTVILTGDGADELFAGYDQYKFYSWGKKLANYPAFIRKSLIPAAVQLTPNVILNKFYKYSSSTGSQMHERFKKFMSRVGENDAQAFYEIFSTYNEQEKKELLQNYQQIDYAAYNKQFLNKSTDAITGVTYMDFKTYLPEDLLMKPDRMCMAFQIEARVPFLDYRLVEYAHSLPGSYKIKGTTTKYVLKQAMKKLIPQHTIDRKKQPFQVPIHNWIAGELKDHFSGLMDDPVTKQFFNKSYLEKIKRNYASSQLYYGRQLWSLATFNLWYKIFIEKQKRSTVL